MMYTSETVEMPVPVAALEATAFTPKPFEPDLSAVAQLCTKLSRVDETSDMAALLEEIAGVIDAVGLMVWLWDPQTSALTPTLPYGYSGEVLAQLPNLPRDARNATAAAFRSAQMCIVSGGDVASDALVVPLMTREGCSGVLAIELRQGGARIESIRALATILAAQMARVVRAARPAAVGNRRLA
jgi:GAF domain-containing protein